MKEKLLLVAGIVAGYAIAVILSSSTTYVIKSVFGTASTANPPFYYLAADLAYSLLYLGIGAYCGTWVARSQMTSVIYGSIFFVLSAITLFAGWDPIHPLWYQIWMVVLVLPIAYLGGYLKLNYKGVKKLTV